MDGLRSGDEKDKTNFRDLTEHFTSIGPLLADVKHTFV